MKSASDRHNCDVKSIERSEVIISGMPLLTKIACMNAYTIPVASTLSLHGSWNQMNVFRQESIVENCNAVKSVSS